VYCKVEKNSLTSTDTIFVFLTITVMKVQIKNQSLLYLRIATTLEQQIQKGVLQPGDKLPSLRSICIEYGVSMSTALQAYLELEKKALVESKPQSGYYVSYLYRHFPPLPAISQPQSGSQNDPADIISKVYHTIGSKKVFPFSISVPAEELLPVAKLNKAMVQAMRELPASGTAYEDVQGNERLRRQIARWAYSWEGRLNANDIVTTAGCKQAVSLCLMALAKAGDTIALESPVYFGLLQLAKSMGLQVIELPTHPQTGVDPDDLKKALKRNKIKVCLLVPNFNNPLGSCMPDENKKATVDLLEDFGVPLIEDDIYGDIFFGKSRPRSCKTYDRSGNVLWCGSVSKTLAPGYRVGWVAPGKHKEQVTKLKLYHTISSVTLTQEVVANFLEQGRYEHHLRKLRRTLHANSLRFIKAIGDYFPEGTKVSRPEGGFVLWMELSKKIDTADLYDVAIQRNISIAPGRIFTLHNQFNNCMRLSYGLLWNEKTNRLLKQLGTMAQKLS
jgi:DNA-binding transcriptional MocR family regulator